MNDKKNAFFIQYVNEMIFIFIFSLSLVDIYDTLSYQIQAI